MTNKEEQQAMDVAMVRTRFAEMIALAAAKDYEVHIHKAGTTMLHLQIRADETKVIANWWPDSKAGTLYIDDRKGRQRGEPSPEPDTREGFHADRWREVLEIAMGQDSLASKVADSASDLPPTSNGDTCEACGTELISDCPTCGAPVCCPKCCSAGPAQILEACTRDELLAEIDRLRRRVRRLDDIFPLFLEARDALPAIQKTSAKLRGIDLTLADRMDAVGHEPTWTTMDDERQENKT